MVLCLAFFSQNDGCHFKKVEISRNNLIQTLIRYTLDMAICLTSKMICCPSPTLYKCI